MTKKDEYNFSEILKNEFPEIVFIDSYAWKNSDIPLKNSISECYAEINSRCVILNTKIVSIDYYKDNYVKKHPVADIYQGGFIGPGMIQFEHSGIAKYSPGGLKGGFIACSYDSKENDEMDNFAKKVFKLCGKNGKTAYRMDPEKLTVAPRPDRKTIAWQDAIDQYDRVNGKFLTMFASNYYTTRV